MPVPTTHKWTWVVSNMNNEREDGRDIDIVTYQERQRHSLGWRLNGGP